MSNKGESGKATMHDVMLQGRLSTAEKHTLSFMSELEDQPKMSYFKHKMVWSFKTAIHTVSYSTYILTLVLPETLT